MPWKKAAQSLPNDRALSLRHAARLDKPPYIFLREKRDHRMD
jgi:hypothetical protein